MWYMHPALVENCIGRGGCCGRECGCCVAPQRANSSAGQLGVGHCTLDCGCCSKNRGFKLRWKQQGDYHETFEFSNELDEEQEEEEQDDGEHDDEKQDDEEKGKEKHDSNDGFKNKNATGFSSYHFRYYLQGWLRYGGSVWMTQSVRLRASSPYTLRNVF